MADESLILNQQSTAADTPENFGFTSPAATGTGTLITAVTVSNDTTLDATYSAFIVISGGSPTTTVVPTRTVKTKKTDSPVELIGQVIPPGGTVQFQSSGANTLAFTVSGRNLT